MPLQCSQGNDRSVIRIQKDINIPESENFLEVAAQVVFKALFCRPNLSRTVFINEKEGKTKKY